MSQDNDNEKQPKKGARSASGKLWTPVFVVIIVLTFCSFVMGQGLNAGTSVYLTGLGYGSTLPGTLALLFSVAAAVARLLIGPIIDSGRCSLVIKAGIAMLVVGSFATTLVEGVPLIAICRLLQGAGFAMATTAAGTAAADVLPVERLGEGIGYHGLGQAIAMSVGPAFALYLVGTDPSSNLYVGLSLVGVVGLVAAFGASYEKHPEKLLPTSSYRLRWEAAQKEGDKPKPRKTLRESLDVFEPRALPGAIPMGILSPSLGFAIFFAGLYGTTLGYANAGLFYTLSAVVMIVIRLFSKRFMDTVPAIKTFAVAVAGAIACFTMLFFAANGEAVFLAAGLFYGVAVGLALPLNQSVAMKNTPSERWGAANALYLLITDVGIGLTSVLWGMVNDAFGFQVSILLAIVLQVVSFIAAWIVYPADQKKWRK